MLCGFPQNALPAGLARREVCTACGEAVFLAERLRLSGRTFHRRCFRCARCGAQLSPANCYETESHAFCCEVCPDEVRGEFSDEELDDAQAAAAHSKEAALAAADVHDEYSVSFESALDDDSAHPVTSAPDLDMISAHSSTNQQKTASPGPEDGTAATATSGGGLVSSRRSLFENIETASGGERRTFKDDKIVAQKDVVTEEEDKENCQQDVEVETIDEETIEPEVDNKKDIATIAFEEFLILDNEMKDDILDMDAQEAPKTEPPALPKSEPPELPKTEPPALVTRPEKTESGLEESSEVKPTPPLRPPPISIDNVNSGTVCIPSSASTNDKTNTSDDEASMNEESVTMRHKKVNEPIVPEILVEKVDDEIYPDDLNPFGDDEEAPVEKKPSPKRVVSLNPFGSDSEEEEEIKPTPRKLIPVDPSLNPFWEEGEEEDVPAKPRTPVPRPRSFNT